MNTNPNHSRAIIIADLGYGDAGKGSLVDALARTTGARTVVRYNGGAQAAHNVITPDGRHHTFAQFGSASLLPDTYTHLSRYMIIHPLAMLAEERHLGSLGVANAFERVSIEREALVTTPFHQAANRIREIARGDGLHGSCGMGVGETMADWLSMKSEALFAGDLANKKLVRAKLLRLREAKREQIGEIMRAAGENPAMRAEWGLFEDADLIDACAEMYAHFARLTRIVGPEHLASRLRQPGTILFEGAQGVLLDEWFGFYPYNSWSTLTLRNAETLLDECGFEGETRRLGMIRGYATRHGAGPFVSEDAELSRLLQDQHNQDNAWQHQFRVGYLDLPALRYAVKLCGRLDGLAVTNLDRMAGITGWRVCEAYTGLEGTGDAERYFDMRGGLAQDIRIPADPTDLVKQERLTRLLMQSRPVYTPAALGEQGYLEQISQALGLPVAVTSRGPTADDKLLHAEWLGEALAA